MGSGPSKKSQAKSVKVVTTAAVKLATPVRQNTQKPSMAAVPDPVGGRVDETGTSHVAWRSVNMAALRQNHPDLPWYELADELVPTTATVIRPDIDRRGWKTVRLFVSSTFKDMHSEREYLVKMIFPQLREWCESRQLRLIECDLRWGVPKDASTRQTLDACLSEIDRCYEENNHPYLLALISERYGWVPSEDQMPPDIKHRYKWIPGMSVTAMELLTGGMWAKNPNALYMLRDNSFIQSLEKTEQLIKVYTEEEEENKKSLAAVKDRLSKLGPDAGVVTTYNCQVSNLTDKRAEMTGFEKFGEAVMEHFKGAMERQYPACALGKELSETEIQYLQHEAFMSQRSELLLGREDVMDEIDRYVLEEREPPVPLVLLGFPGSGKSAVMATVARRLSPRTSSKVVYHFVGATPGSTDLLAMLGRIWREFMPSEDKPPTDANELRRSLGVVLESAARRAQEEGQRRVILIIDALNQLDDDDAEEKILDWLPRTLPSCIRVIVSTLEGTSLDALRKKGAAKLPEVLVAPLGVDTRRAIVTQILSEYNKVLDEQQLSCLVSKADAGRPLYLSIASEELRVFGEFRKLTAKIQGIPDDMTNLLVHVLDRIIAENGGELVVATLSLIECSRHGLLENELLELLAPFSNMDAAVDKLPMAEWAIVYLGLRRFLRPAGGSGEGRLDFYHRSISKSVRTKYMDNPDKKKAWQQRIIDYFQKSNDLDRRAEELPYQLSQIKDIDGLKLVLVEQEMFSRLNTPTSRQNLTVYWLQAGGYKLAADLSLEALNTHIKKHKEILPHEVQLNLRTEMLDFLIYIGEYSQAEGLLETIVKHVTKHFGEKSIQMCKPLYLGVLLFHLQSLRVVYGSSPIYKRCREIGRDYAEECSMVHKLHYKKDDLHLGTVLTKCGAFLKGSLEEAKIICKGRNEKDYAEILYSLGKYQQYGDFSVLVETFEESVKLCLKHFGQYHLTTARCHQLYGQIHWNRMTRGLEHDMESCLGYYQVELDILETLVGAHHPTTVRSREDVIIILQRLGRRNEAADFQKFQPKS